MTATLPSSSAVGTAPLPGAPYGSVRLAAGILGRAWLWFLAGCLVITLVPALVGWRPYLIESGSMGPRISVGDVVVASPTQDPLALVGHVAVFTDPDRPDRNKTHRVVSVAPDGRLVTKGDANATNDSTTVDITAVHGMGRLLVRFVGLPLLWWQTGQWAWLLLFLASILIAARAVSLDDEDEDEPGTDPPDLDRGEVLPIPTGPVRATGLDIAATKPSPLTSWTARRRLVRVGYGAALAAALLLPTSAAAFGSTTTTAASSWQVPNWDYTTAVTDLDPYLYWKLDDTSTSSGNAGRTAVDSSGNGRTGQYNTNGGTAYFTKSVTGALTTDTPNRAVTLENQASCINTAANGDITAPVSLTEVVWFRTTTTQGGKLLGFETPRTGVQAAGNGGTYDRHLYLDGSGHVWFGVYQGGDNLVTSPTALNDGVWHMAAATLGPAGMALYVDGALVDSDSNTTGEASSGWFRAGCGNLAGWADGWNGPNAPPASGTPTNYPFRGSLDEISIWTSALTAAQIHFLYFAR